MNRTKFFDTLRADPVVFTKGFRQSQVDGINNLLSVAEKYMPEMQLDEISYNFATAYHETGQTMQPIVERGVKSYFDKYEPNTKIGQRLGNTQKGDGYKYRGEGHVQNTGRRNALFSSTQLNKQFGLRTDFVNNPSQRGDPLYSALCLFFGNRQGWWTGKSVLMYLDGVDESAEEDFREFKEARRVVNGIDKQEVIAQFAVSFKRAFKAAGYVKDNKQPELPKLVEQLAPQVPQPKSSWIGFLMSLFFNRR